MSVELLFDLLVVAALAFAALRAIHSRRLFTGVVVYIVFGVLMAIVWVRLAAPDLAIAEAAIGAGVTGAMLLGASRQLGHDRPAWRWSARAWPAAGLAVGFAAAAAGVFLTVGGREGPLPDEVSRQLARSGVESPVTAVLLNFRGYDTWLEVGVLLVAALAVLALQDRSPAASAEAEVDVEPPGVAASAARLLSPLGILIAGYLLWRGSHGPGGAFQAGAVLAAVAILRTLLGDPPLSRVSARMRTGLLVLGFALFLTIGMGGLLSTGSYLQYPPDLAATAILAIEAAVTVSVATTLALLFVGAERQSDRRRPRGS